jgi:hypothetical protein
MKFKSLIFTEASGSIAGMTFSHNRGGLYVRARSIPTNPGSPAQNVVRAAFGFLVAAWSSILTEVQREAWRTYAENVPLVDKLGELRNVTGQNMYIRSNTMRSAFGYPIVDDAPTDFTLAVQSAPQFAPTAATDVVAVTFNETDPWVDIDDAHLVVYASRPQNESVKYFKGPYQFAGSIDGDALTAPTSPQDVPLPFPVEVGHRIFFMTAVTQADGRRSLDFRDFAPAA